MHIYRSYRPTCMCNKGEMSVTGHQTRSLSFWQEKAICTDVVENLKGSFSLRGIQLPAKVWDSTFNRVVGSQVTFNLYNEQVTASQQRKLLTYLHQTMHSVVIRHIKHRPPLLYAIHYLKNNGRQREKIFHIFAILCRYVHCRIANETRKFTFAAILSKLQAKEAQGFYKACGSFNSVNAVNGRDILEQK